MEFQIGVRSCSQDVPVLSLQLPLWVPAGDDEDRKLGGFFHQSVPLIAQFVPLSCSIAKLAASCLARAVQSCLTRSTAPLSAASFAAAALANALLLTGEEEVSNCKGVGLTGMVSRQCQPSGQTSITVN